MSWGMVAVAGASLVAGKMGADASKDAAATQAGSADRASAVQREMYTTTRKDLAPYRNAGSTALQRLMMLTGVGAKGRNNAAYGSLTRPFEEFEFSKDDFEADPGYEFRLSEGERAIERGALARGMNASTGTLRQLVRYNQGMASDEFQRSYGRGLQTFTTNFGVDTANRERQSNALQYLVSGGQNAAAMTGSAGANAANSTANALISSGNAAAAGILGSASSWNNAIQGGIGNFMYQRRFDDMMKRMPVFGARTPTPSGPVWGDNPEF